MDKADTCRRAAVEAVADVEPPRLSALVDSVLEEASMVPGALTIESAVTLTPDGTSSLEDPTTATDSGTETSTASTTGAAARDTGIVTHAAGVQLIYEGLRLTRTLAHEEPWNGTSAPAKIDATAKADTDTDTDTDQETDTAPTAEEHTADLEILAADILVARGFYLLARTDAAGKAVRIVQAFGRDQTRRSEDTAGTATPASTPSGTDGTLDDRPAGSTGTETTATGTTNTTHPDPTSIDTNLERDVLELAVRTGAAAVDEPPTPHLLALATNLANELADSTGPSFPPAEDCLTSLDPSPPDRSLEDYPTDRVTSATDP